ncbi:MbcA/ParS/Xre antitoxin family protein [Rhizobium sp. S152]|uniref:MbcA/ParS/Xre antitoxin family protein n=1 Tax=Rhizobium sp. S152 TaxID=3055038 RepID=UPI0025AA000E|nr:MbcA/ParS/Xre antitoxin family protein [Rhizobium sp. S152]MDM9626531.1 MbcA/ParS/Xre antitoxin family protein [Rhizobium sp. S152]
MVSSAAQSRDDSTLALVETASGSKQPRFDSSSIETLKNYGFSMDEIYRFVAPRRTLARRLEQGEPLTLAENDSAQRLLRVSQHADRVFGEREKAQRWLRKPSRALNGVVPFDLLQSETGARLVEEELIRIDHGIYI